MIKPKGYLFMTIDLKKLIDAGVAFGHPSSNWSPRMAPYIWGRKNKIYLIDVSKTAYGIEKAGQALQKIAAAGKTIMLVGTKKPARAIIERCAQALDLPYVSHRWIGGTLTNFSQVKKSITKLLHYEDVLTKSDSEFYTKKERNVLQKKVHRLIANIGGIRSFRWPLGAIVIVDVRKEQAALREASMVGIPVIGIVDTNSDPSLIDYVIPANDDSPKSLNIIFDYLSEYIKAGKEAAAAQGVAAQETAAAGEGEQDVLKATALLEAEDTEEAAGTAENRPAKAKRFKAPDAAGAKKAEVKKKA